METLTLFTAVSFIALCSFDVTDNPACPSGFTVIFSALGTQGSEVTSSSELLRVNGGPASGEGLPSSQSYDYDLEKDEELSGGDNEKFNPHGRTIKDKLFFLTLILNPNLMFVCLG